VRVAEWILEWLQRPLFQIDVPEVIEHEADEPDSVLNLANADRLTGV
jgi:hypothetical protein